MFAALFSFQRTPARLASLLPTVVSDLHIITQDYKFVNMFFVFFIIFLKNLVIPRPSQGWRTW